MRRVYLIRHGKPDFPDGERMCLGTTDIPLPGEEDPAKGLERFRAAMEQAAEKSSGDIAVVAHGGVIAAFSESLGGRREKPGYAGIIPLTYDGTFHLQEEANHAEYAENH